MNHRMGGSVRARLGATALAVVTATSAMSFVLATPAAARPATPIGAFTPRGAWSFISAPLLHPPKLRMVAHTKHAALAPGDFLLANFPNVTAPGPMDGQSGPLIVNNDLQPVWFDPVPPDVVAADLKQQTYDGHPVLSWWQGVVTDTGATTSGEVIVVNDAYHTVATLKGDTKAGWVISPHEVDIRGRDAWVTSYKTLHGIDLAAYGGAKDGTLEDFAVQEYDLHTGRLLYTWDAYNPGGTPHVALSQSDQLVPTSPSVPWDAYHGNSIELVGAHDFLVSMRDTSAAYLVDRRTGKVIWTLGGKDSNFTIPPNAHFAWQHHVELHHAGIVTLFDDDCCAIVGPGKFAAPNGPAKGLVLRLHFKQHRVTLVHQYLHGHTFAVAFMGSMQVLTDHKAVVGWGSKPYFTEFSRTGRALLDAKFPGKDLSYRTLYTDDWVGRPSDPPAGAVRKTNGTDVIYASWNGATQVAEWEVLAGTSSTRLSTVATSARTGFETAIHLHRTYRHFEVRALGAGGRRLGTSPSFSAVTPGFY